jgi:hypothetical protein
LNRFGFSRPRALQRKKLQDYKCKNKNATLRHKNIEKHAYVGSQSKFGKTKKGNSKIPESHLLLLESMKYVKKVVMV